MNQKMLMKVGIAIVIGVALFYGYKKFVKPKLESGITKDTPPQETTKPKPPQTKK